MLSPDGLRLGLFDNTCAGRYTDGMNADADSMGRMDRRQACLYRGHDRGDSYVPGTPAYRVAVVWELTRELWLLSGADVERRLQRDVAVLVRRGG